MPVPLRVAKVVKNIQHSGYGGTLMPHHDRMVWPIAVPVFKIREQALFQKTQESIAKVGGNRYMRLMDTGNCGSPGAKKEAEIHIDTDITGQWAPRG